MKGNLQVSRNPDGRHEATQDTPAPIGASVRSPNRPQGKYATGPVVGSPRDGTKRPGIVTIELHQAVNARHLHGADASVPANELRARDPWGQVGRPGPQHTRIVLRPRLCPYPARTCGSPMSEEVPAWR